MPLFARVGDRVATAIGRPGTSPPPRPPAPLPLDAFENYAKALVAVTPAVQQHLLEAALKQAPRDGRILTALSAVYTAEGLHDRALAVAANVPADSPQSRKGRFLAAMALIDLGRLDGAFRELTALNTERPAAVLENATGVVQLRRGEQCAGRESTDDVFQARGRSRSRQHRLPLQPRLRLRARSTIRRPRCRGCAKRFAMTRRSATRISS